MLVSCTYSLLFEGIRLMAAGDDVAIQAWLAEHRPTRCPTAAAGPTTGRIPFEDARALEARDAALAERRRAQAAEHQPSRMRRLVSHAASRPDRGAEALTFAAVAQRFRRRIAT